jgi:hypothetical protein
MQILHRNIAIGWDENPGTLDYEIRVTSEGCFFSGIAQLHHPIKFTYTVLKDKEPEFFPASTNPLFQHLIIEIITSDYANLEKNSHQ